MEYEILRPPYNRACDRLRALGRPVRNRLRSRGSLRCAAAAAEWRRRHVAGARQRIRCRAARDTRFVRCCAARDAAPHGVCRCGCRGRQAAAVGGHGQCHTGPAPYRASAAAGGRVARCAAAARSTPQRVCAFALPRRCRYMGMAAKVGRPPTATRLSCRAGTAAVQTRRVPAQTWPWRAESQRRCGTSAGPLERGLHAPVWVQASHATGALAASLYLILRHQDVKGALVANALLGGAD